MVHLVINNSCPVCKKPTGTKVYCSVKCRSQGRKNGKEFPCEACGKLIYILPSDKNKRFCSVYCSTKTTQNSKKRMNGKIIICPICNNTLYVNPSTLKLRKNGIKYCSAFCKNQAIRESKTSFGFKKTKTTEETNPYPRKQINKIRMKEHRRIMEVHLGRKLLRTEIVHHINNNPKDNRIENLLLTNASDHGKIHKTSIP